jgi:3-phytase
VKISTSKVALVAFALLTILVLVLFAGRTEDPLSGALSTGPTTPAPVTALASGAPSADPTTPPPAKLTATAVPSFVVGVRLENIGFSGSGDVSDDAAIWVDSANPRRSVVIANNKDDAGGGIGVFGMNGKLIQFSRDGEIGNVDLRTGFPSRKSSVVLVGANNRSTNTLALWTLSTKTRHLSRVNDRSIKATASNYGFCLYHSKISGKFYAFVTPDEKGFIQHSSCSPELPA